MKQQNETANAKEEESWDHINKNSIPEKIVPTLKPIAIDNLFVIAVNKPIAIYIPIRIPMYFNSGNISS